MAQLEESSDYNTYLGRELSELIILSALSPDKGYSAYRLIQKIKEETNEKIKFRAGTIYPQMVKLEQRGLLSKTVEDTASRSAGVKRQKSVYSLTAAGIKDLNRKKGEWADLQNVINRLIQNGT
jgi:DNA-binding PadR family transcriptional regulator